MYFGNYKYVTQNFNSFLQDCCSVLDDIGKITIGKPIANTEVYILDDKQNCGPEKLFIMELFSLFLSS